MAHYERIKDHISTPFAPSLIDQRTAAGWQIVAIEWRRELPDAEAPTPGAYPDEIPYGLRISADCQRLETHPTEHSTLLQMMDLVVEDFPFSAIASDLNEKGFRTRSGALWNQVSVFNMLPRLIEMGPRLFTKEDWKIRRQRLARTL